MTSPVLPLSILRLEDRWNPAASLTMAGEFNSVEYAPDGRIHELLWDDNQLELLTRQDGIPSSREIVLTEDDPLSNRFVDTPGYYARRPDQAQLVIAPDGAMHVFKIASDSRLGYLLSSGHLLPGGADELSIEHYRKIGSSWNKVERIVIPGDTSGGIYHLVADAGADGQLHLGISVGTSDLKGGVIYYATRTTGAWKVEKIMNVGPLSGILTNSGATAEVRSLDMAIDGANKAHFAFSTGYSFESLQPGTIGAAVLSDLAYATNRGGTFQRTVISRIADGSGDAALSMSIDVAANGTVGIAAHEVDRAVTGSPQSSKLVFFTQTGEMSFRKEVVVDQPDGYVASDGAHFTGSSPDLEFDPSGRAVIAFSDHATRHDPYAIESAGQIRLAVREGNDWRTVTVFRQNDPTHQQVAFPTLRTSADEYTIVGLIHSNDDFDIARFRYDPQSGRSAAVELTAAPAPTIPSVPPISAPSLPITPTRQDVVVSTDVGGTAWVSRIGANGQVRNSWTVFESGFTGGVRTASADVNGDGIDDVIVGAGPGRAPTVIVYDGQAGSELFRFDAFESTFGGGVFVSAADLNNDGRAEIVVSPDENGGPRVRILSGADLSVMADFFGIDDPAFRGGVRTALGDIDGDSIPDLLVGAGIGGGPRLAIFDGGSLQSGNPPEKLIADFFLFEASLRNGVFLSAGDLDGDGFAEIVAGGGPGGGPRVLALSGHDLIASDGTALNPVANFFGGDVNSRGGIRVTVQDLDGDDRADLVVGSGSGAGSRVTSYSGEQITPDTTPSELWSLDAFPDFSGGIFVG